MPEDLKGLYRSLRKDIDARLGEFTRLWESGSDREVFREMCFCMCTPQNDAKKAWAGVLELDRTKLLYSGGNEEVAALLQKGGVRFHVHKSNYITENRRVFYPRTKAVLAALLAPGDIPGARTALSGQVRGWGLKESSHFLRNIGFGKEICILDRHILRQLNFYGVIPAVPKSLTGPAYTGIEKKMLLFAEETGIPPDALDLVFWFKAKNELFK